jgi:predicted acyl esterase
VLIGRPVLDLRATLSAADANFYVHLLDVDDKDMETLVNDGYLKASHRTSHTSPEPVRVGECDVRDRRSDHFAPARFCRRSLI